MQVTHTHRLRLLLRLTGEDEFLLHDVEVSAGPPDRGTQHDLFRVVAVHATQPPLLEYKNSYNYSEGDEISSDPDQTVFIWTHEPDGVRHLSEDVGGFRGDRGDPAAPEYRKQPGLVDCVQSHTHIAPGELSDVIGAGLAVT